MSKASAITIALALLFAGGCKEQSSGRDDALEAMRELANEQPGMAFGSMFSVISADARIRKGARMRPDNLSFFSMLQKEDAVITYKVFMIGDDIPGKDSWELHVAGKKLQPDRIDPGSWGDDIDKQINGRFSYFALEFNVHRDDFIEAFKEQPVVSLSCPELTDIPWIFRSEEFATKLQQVREMARNTGERAMEVHLYSREIDFYANPKTEPAQQDVVE